MSKCFETRGLCFSYYRKELAFKDVSFSAEIGDRIVIFGVEGSGKTTLIKVLSGFENSYFGSVKFEGNEIKKIPDEEKKFSLILDEPIFINSTIQKNLEFVCNVSKLDSNEIDFDKLLSRFEIDKSVSEKIKNLTFFEKVKLSFVRAFVKQSKVIFVDDIFVGLTHEETERIIKIINKNLRSSLMFFCLSDDSSKKFGDNLNLLEPKKYLYLSLGKVYEFKTPKEFFAQNIDINVHKFNNFYKTFEAIAFFENNSYYIEIDGVRIKLDKIFEDKLKKLEIQGGEEERILIVCENQLQVDFTENEKCNDYFRHGKLMMFMCLSGERVI